MPRVTEADRIKVWQDRLLAANKIYDKWSDRYRTRLLEDYYLGRQWAGLAEDEADRKYTINLVFSSIETNKPSLVFYRPQIRIQPRPGRASTFGSDAEQRARLSEDVVQTFIDDPDVDFAMETNLALHEAHFRFGVVEVGYTADWIDNPNAGKPVLKEDDETPVRDQQGDVIVQPDRLVQHEALYIKRIPAKRFRVSISSQNKVSRNDWVGYYEWHYLEDVKANKEYRNTANLKATGILEGSLRRPDDDPNDLDQRHGMVKLWKVWDLRQGVRHILVDGHQKFLVEGKPYRFLPFAIMKFHEVLDEFYPIPPVFQWLGPQDEVNEVRESQRAHRRRFYRRYTYQDGAIDPVELEKLETGGDGVYAKTNMPDPIKPVPDAPLGADQWRHLDESKSDFVQVSGVTAEQRGVAESETATQATILDTRSRLREASARTRVADWLAAIARLILLAAREHMALPFWVKRQVDLTSLGAAEAAQVIANQWQQIQAEDLGDIDLDIFVDLASMSPVTEEVQRNSWNQVLAVLTNPSILALVAESEVLLRKTLSLYGIRAETEIREIQRVAQALVMTMAQAAGVQAGAGETGPASPSPSGAPAPAIPGPPAFEQLMGERANVGRGL